MDRISLSPSPAPPLRESLARARARLLVFDSRSRTCRETDVLGVEAPLAGRPALVPGLSLVVGAQAHSMEVAACLVCVRRAVPLLPVLCVLPQARDELGSEILHLCGMLGVRVWQEEGWQAKAEPAVLEGILRQEPAAPDLDFASFLERRGHRVPGGVPLDSFIGRLLEPRGIGEVGPWGRRERGAWLRRSRKVLEAAGLRSFRRFRSVVRLVLAGIRLYSASRRTIAEVAASLQFASPFSLSNEMLRYLGKRPSEVRNLYPWEWMLDSALPEPRSPSGQRGRNWLTSN